MGPPEMGMSSFLLASQPKRCTRDKEARNPEEGEEVHIYVPPELVSFMCGGTLDKNLHKEKEFSGLLSSLGM